MKTPDRKTNLFVRWHNTAPWSLYFTGVGVFTIFFFSVASGLVLLKKVGPNFIPPPVPTTIDADDLHAELLADPAKFRAEREGKEVTVTGRVVGPFAMYDGHHVELARPKKNSKGYVVVVFVSPADCSTALGSRRVTVRGFVHAPSDTLWIESADLLSYD
jgi:hypothetical protein